MKGLPAGAAGATPGPMTKVAQSLGLAARRRCWASPPRSLAAGSALHFAAKADEKTIKQGANRANIGGTYGSDGRRDGLLVTGT